MTSTIMHSAIPFIALLLLTTGVPAAQAQETSQDEPDTREKALEGVRDSFARGDARALLEYATDRIEMTLFGRSTHYSRGQAIYVMEEFFRDYPPEQFAVEETSGTEGHWFMAYEYWTSRGQAPMQVFIRLREHEDDWLVREIRVERRR